MPQIVPRLISLGTAVPSHRITQADVLTILAQAKGQALPPRMAEILGNTGISHRHIAMPPEYYFDARSWAKRAGVYEAVATQIFEKAAMQALARANLQPADIGQIVFNLIEAGVVGKTEDDTLAAFSDGFDFQQAFVHPFLPSAKILN
jgi:alkylresorcinol/alkylpyrone synthase